jgi:hypothetical protein
MIQLQGLTKQDVEICRLLWNCDSWEAIEALLAAMPEAYKQRAVIMRELMIAGELDNLEVVHEDVRALLHTISTR